MEKTVELKDMLGNVLVVGDCVAFASYKNLGLTIGWVTKLGRVRAEVSCDHSSPSRVAPWLMEGWAESFRTEELIKIEGV